MALTDAQLADNHVYARRRIKVEYAISGAKRLGWSTRTYRNKSLTINGRVMVIACGI